MRALYAKISMGVKSVRYLNDNNRVSCVGGKDLKEAFYRLWQGVALELVMVRCYNHRFINVGF